MSLYALVCGGCGATASETSPFGCPNAKAKDDIDHVLSRRLDLRQLRLGEDDAPETFVRFRRFLAFWHLAQAHGLSEADVIDEVRRLDDAIADVDGRGFVETPLFEAAALGRQLGQSSLFVKDETNNVSGSHKARHLMNVALYLAVAERVELIEPGAALAISSCGNAALAAAVIAKASRRPLSVFVPDWADSAVIDRLDSLGATIQVCKRQVGMLGDPCTAAMREAVRNGAIPFSCQGPDNGLSVEGGVTLGYELVEQLQRQQLKVDRVYVQVGGGALLSSLIQALFDAKTMGHIETLPKIYAVQAEGAAPLARAYQRLAEWLGADPSGSPLEPEALERAIEHATHHRSDFMTPWDGPKSVAHGILDDETYDWVWILRGLLASGGQTVVVPDATIQKAHDLVRSHTDVLADATGAAGLGGLIAHGQTDGRALVLLTGKDRSAHKEGS